MMQKYSTPPKQRQPCLVPGFITLLPLISEALGPHITPDQSFPQWVAPGPLGDWAPAQRLKRA